MQTAEDHNNNLEERTTGSISLFPYESIQVSYYFYNLNTGKKIHRRQWIELPMTRDVIVRVETMGRKDGQTEMVRFGDRNDCPIED